ncbi:MAG TPA: tRNA (guanosine(37)-N1)-methyltransferase TrmD [Spirochaetota bacterium]|nr:tRNA (guanosine(37)-N1)-methyltransferase TrmD [Spirochaetota bacterium]HPJ35463.1 tRNA (guanosine(37)-N1)-methyltransferase TrmD [Spirochaetota bacterium]
MIFKIYTLFPDFFESPLKSGLMGKAVESGIVDIRIIDIREYSEDRFRRCDDYPYGGGSGMVIMPGPLFRALESNEDETSKVLYASPSGEPLSQEFVKGLSREESVSIICGHYEGIDQRVIETFVEHEVSTGDYVLSGGEFAALIIVDAVARNIPGFMSNSESLVEESFESDLLEYPHYTRPAEFRGMKVPEVLISGDHSKIAAWRHEMRIEKTRSVRPDLYKNYLMRIILGE